MPIMGKQCFILAETGKIVNVNPFSPKYKVLTTRLVDTALQYDCPYSGQSYILVIWNAMYALSMENNLLPPFVFREAGITVNDKPKIHTQDPTTGDHIIVFPEMGFQIPLFLWGVFSYFSTCTPTTNTLQGNENVYILTPPNWDPHNECYSTNEESHAGWEGEIRQKKDWKMEVVIEDKLDGDEEASYEISSAISSAEAHTIVTVCDQVASGEDNNNTIGEETHYPHQWLMCHQLLCQMDCIGC